MNRNVTNVLRFVMDELIPPIIRDNRYFMYPAYYFWFKGKNIKSYMDFKSYVNNLTEEEFEDVYRKLEIKANDRSTDLNKQSVSFMLENLDKKAVSLLDAGCGRGYWLNKVAENTSLELAGCDLYDDVKLNRGTYIKANAENLPFEDEQFDIVTSHHTIEHVRDPDKMISELKRIAKRQLIIATPCQRYNYYTLDLHVNFYPKRSLLTSLINMDNFTCKKIFGDWVYIGMKNSDV